MKRYKSKKYLDYVRTLPCSLCGRPGPSVPHHLKGIGNMSGVGTKAGDQYTMPLCGDCHHRMHHEPELWPEQWEFVARVMGRAVEHGLRFGNRE